MIVMSINPQQPTTKFNNKVQSFIHSFIHSFMQGSYLHCAVPENSHTPHTEGIGISWGVGGSVRPKKFKEMYEA